MGMLLARLGRENVAILLKTQEEMERPSDITGLIYMPFRDNEMGMLLARLGRENVAILLKTQEEMERPSDITGLIYMPFRDNIVKEAGVSLAKAMDVRGYSIEIAKL